ncbi:MAG: transposase [Bacillota bacterium]|nr:transposase [Bacillota bacterium]
MIDDPCIQVHLHASGKKGRARKQGIGRSGRGYTTKNHAVVDALGNPFTVYLTAGNVSDYTPANDLITEFDLENSYVPADKGYDSQAFVRAIEEKDGIPVTPFAGTPRIPDHTINTDKRSVFGRRFLPQTEEQSPGRNALQEDIHQLSWHGPSDMYVLLLTFTIA